MSEHRDQITQYNESNKTVDFCKPFKDEAQTALFKTSSYRAVNTFHLDYRNQSVNEI